MSLRKAQSEFLFLTTKLIRHIYSTGYEATYGDAYRDPRVHGEWGEKKSYSHPESNHKRRLALDLNLFKDGTYLAGTDEHERFGTYWESLHPWNRWGGRFKDGNHYEMVYGGWR